MNATKKVFKIPRKCTGISPNDLTRALEYLLFYPPAPDDFPKTAGEKEVQKRFSVTPHDQHLISQIKQTFHLHSDKDAVGIALLWFLG